MKLSTQSLLMPTLLRDVVFRQLPEFRLSWSPNFCTFIYFHFSATFEAFSPNSHTFFRLFRLFPSGQLTSLTSNGIKIPTFLEKVWGWCYTCPVSFNDGFDKLHKVAIQVSQSSDHFPAEEQGLTVDKDGFDKLCKIGCRSKLESL